MNFFRTAKWIFISSRPYQWYKNVLILAGIVFSANITNATMWKTVAFAFLYFCMLSSSEYLINDIIDKERDRAHPIKAKRPIASGQLKEIHAILFAVALIILALLGAYVTVNVNFFIISAAYCAIAIAYSYILKQWVIIDILVVSSGFVIRAIAGALAIGVPFSFWLVVCTALLALFLTIEKRWSEIALLSKAAGTHRANLAKYSPKLLEQFSSIVTGTLIVSYMLYTYEYAERTMLLTTPFVVYGLFRYLYLIHQKRFRAEPEVVFRDKSMLINLGIWVVMVISIIAYRVWR
jgi:4-hydroxybenzoate polyprenyltransferase